MFAEKTKSKCLDDVHYVCVISIVGSTTSLKINVPNFWKYKEIRLTILPQSLKITCEGVYVFRMEMN